MHHIRRILGSRAGTVPRHNGHSLRQAQRIHIGKIQQTVVIAGIVIVLGILVLLIFVFKAFGAIVHGAETRGKKKKLKAMESQVTVASAPSAPAVKAAPAAPAPVVESGIPGEVVAVIAAAVAASEGPGAVVQSVRRVRPNPVGVRNPWAAAAVAENTRPF
jgi:glutaconyl-CoA/methylmalonyl-CoA decarboxylase subunit delta